MTIYEIDEQVVILNCEHIFHKSCIIEWLSNSKCCPLCRTNLLTNELLNNNKKCTEFVDDEKMKSNNNLLDRCETLL